MPGKLKLLRTTLRNGEFGQNNDNSIDIELGNPSKSVGLNANLVPLQSSVAGGRVFYGSRFQTQALPLVTPEAALVQNLDPDDPDGKSFDDKMGEHAGAIFAKDNGIV